ncbi:MAG: radical SAM protein [Candidatus Gastranaerophilales bacterium]|nr:radical SAM protein [Candidatus Gastranaerophilales bacterium]
MNREDRCQQPTSELVVIPPLPPVDMMSLSAIAKKRGYETQFKDYSLKGETVYDFLRDLRTYKPDFLVLNIASTTLEKDLSILSNARDLLEDTVVIVKGAIFNFSSYSIMQKYPEIDVALRGEIEEAFDEIIQYKNFKEIKGITYQINNKIISTADRELKADIDNLPILDRNLIDNSIYIRPDTKKPQTIIRVSKGCPNHCFFCLASPLNGKMVRYRSPELILDEIKECVSLHNIKDFIFWSDIFNLNKEWVQKLCRLIIESGYKINFSANTRVDTVDWETLCLMKKAGCNLISMGVESGSQELLDKMGKKITLEQIKKTVSMIHRAGIQTYAYYVIGLPWETRETLKKTFDFAKKLNTHYASFYTATALQGTKFYEYVNKNRLGEISLEKPYIFPSVKSYELSSQEIFEANKKFNKEYYLRASYILKMAFSVNSLTKFKTYYDTFIRLLKAKN